LRKAATAAKTDTFLGERYRRLVRRMGKGKALVAAARPILVVVWHLLADPTARVPGPRRRLPRQPHRPRPQDRNLVHQLQALGYKVTLQHKVTLEPAA
jgi:transposase